MTIIRNIYLSARFFQICTGLIIWFCVSFFVPVLFWPGCMLLGLFIAVVMADFVMLFSTKKLLQGHRRTKAMWSLNDDNEVEIRLRNLSNKTWHIEVIDELPFQFQRRDFSKHILLQATSTHELQYSLQPKSRGLYEFGDIQLLIGGRLNLVNRRINIEAAQAVKVYPSINQMKQLEIYSLSKIARLHGIKKNAAHRTELRI